MATTYIHFTEEQKEQARRTDLRSLLLGQGEKVERSGSEYKWNHGGEKITIRGNLWFNQYEPDSGGGDAIAFVREFYGLDFPEVVQFLLKQQALPSFHKRIYRKRRKSLLPFQRRMRTCEGFMRIF